MQASNCDDRDDQNQRPFPFQRSYKFLQNPTRYLLSTCAGSRLVEQLIDQATEQLVKFFVNSLADFLEPTWNLRLMRVRASGWASRTFGDSIVKLAVVLLKKEKTASKTRLNSRHYSEELEFLWWFLILNPDTFLQGIIAPQYCFSQSVTSQNGPSAHNWDSKE